MKRFYNFIYSIIKPVLSLRNRPSVTGRENIPEGAAILCINHRCMLDPLMVIIAAGKSHWLRYMAKEELFHVPVLGGILSRMGSFGVKRGAADIGAVKKALTVLREGGKLGIFPQGTRVPEGLGDSIKAGAAMLAVRTGAPVVPVYLDDPGRAFRKVRVFFGEAFTPTLPEGLPKSEQYKVISEEILEHMRSLAEKARVSK